MGLVKSYEDDGFVKLSEKEGGIGLNGQLKFSLGWGVIGQHFWRCEIGQTFKRRGGIGQNFWGTGEIGQTFLRVRWDWSKFLKMWD